VARADGPGHWCPCRWHRQWLDQLELTAPPPPAAQRWMRAVDVILFPSGRRGRRRPPPPDDRAAPTAPPDGRPGLADHGQRKIRGELCLFPC